MKAGSVAIQKNFRGFVARRRSRRRAPRARWRRRCSCGRSCATGSGAGGAGARPSSSRCGSTASCAAASASSRRAQLLVARNWRRAISRRDFRRRAAGHGRDRARAAARVPRAARARPRARARARSSGSRRSARRGGCLCTPRADEVKRQILLTSAVDNCDYPAEVQRLFCHYAAFGMRGGSHNRLGLATLGG